MSSDEQLENEVDVELEADSNEDLFLAIALSAIGAGLVIVASPGILEPSSTNTYAVLGAVGLAVVGTFFVFVAGAGYQHTEGFFEEGELE